jgi:hypothetical protein
LATVVVALRVYTRMSMSQFFLGETPLATKDTRRVV